MNKRTELNNKIFHNVSTNNKNFDNSLKNFKTKFDLIQEHDNKKLKNVSSQISSQTNNINKKKRLNKPKISESKTNYSKSQYSHKFNLNNFADNSSSQITKPSINKLDQIEIKIYENNDWTPFFGRTFFH